MIVTIKQITDKIKDLPPDYAEHVHCGKPGNAEVESFSDPTQEKPYIVHIAVAETEDLLNVTCSCRATKLCLHVVAYYCMVKDLKPSTEEPIPLPLEKEDEPDKGNEAPEQEKAAKELAEAYRKIGVAYEGLAAALGKIAEAFEDDHS